MTWLKASTSSGTWHSSWTQEMSAVFVTSEHYTLQTCRNKSSACVSQRKNTWDPRCSLVPLCSDPISVPLDMGVLCSSDLLGISSYTSSIQAFTFAVSYAWQILLSDILMTCPITLLYWLKFNLLKRTHWRIALWTVYNDTLPLHCLSLFIVLFAFLPLPTCYVFT